MKIKSPDWPKWHEYLMICLNIFSSPNKKKQNKKEQNMTRKERKTRDDTRRDKMKPDNGKEVYLLVKKALK